MSSDVGPIEPWDIWHARFDFSEGKGYKYRPVLVVAVQGDAMLAAMITSADNKLVLPHDHPIVDWEEAGLEKPSIARLDRIIKIPRDYIGTQRLIGHLSKEDKSAISLKLNSMV